jgi:hypothetical protein
MNQIPEDYEPSWWTCTLTFLGSIPLIAIGLHIDNIVAYSLATIGILLSQSTVFLPIFFGLYDKGFNLFKDRWNGSRRFLAVLPFWLVVCIFVSLNISGHNLGLVEGTLALVSLISSAILMAIS